MVQAGTATSTRVRGESNSFNVIRIGAGRITIERHGWREGGAAFELAGAETFARSGGVWAAVLAK